MTFYTVCPWVDRPVVVHVHANCNEIFDNDQTDNCFDN